MHSVQQDVGEYLEAERSYLQALNTSVAATVIPSGSPFYMMWEVYT